MKHLIKTTINKDFYEISIYPWQTLNEVLREDLNLTGTKLGCGSGDCGACTVMVNGKTVNSCLTLAIEIDGMEVTTIEGLNLSGEKLHPIQQSFVEKGAIQCGFCTPGMEMSAFHLIKRKKNPNEMDIKKGISGNLCRCTGYSKIIDAIAEASKIMKRETEVDPS